MFSVLAQMGVPGGPEIIVILMIALFFAIPVLVIMLIIKLARNPADETLQKRVALLEHEVAELREQIESDE